MNDNKKLRNLKVLLYNNYYMHTESFENHKNFILGLAKEGNVSKHWLDRVKIFNIAEELKISDSILRLMWMNMSKLRTQNYLSYSASPQKEGRDNKNVHVGSGGRNKNMVRYPSKKRSVYTWKKFYTLFPYLAEEDNWDGKTSNKMK